MWLVGCAAGGDSAQFLTLGIADVFADRRDAASE